MTERAQGITHQLLVALCALNKLIVFRNTICMTPYDATMRSAAHTDTWLSYLLCSFLTVKVNDVTFKGIAHAEAVACLFCRSVFLFM